MLPQLAHQERRQFLHNSEVVLTDYLLHWQWRDWPGTLDITCSYDGWAHINLGAFLLTKRLKGSISDGHLRFTSILAKRLGNIKTLCDERLLSSHRAGSPISSWPSWPATARQGRNRTAVMWNHRLHSPAPCLARLWARHYWAVLPGHSNASRYWVLLCQQLFAMCILSFLQSDNVSAKTVKSSPLEKRLNCLRALPSRSKRSKTTVCQNSWVALVRSC